MATSSYPFNYFQLRQLTHDFLFQRLIVFLLVMRVSFTETISKEQLLQDVVVTFELKLLSKLAFNSFKRRYADAFAATYYYFWPGLLDRLAFSVISFAYFCALGYSLGL